MENNKQEDSGKGCGCGTGCCGGRKAICGLLLLLVGAVGGFFAGKCCHKMCDMKDKPAAEASASPAAPAATETPAAPAQ